MTQDARDSYIVGLARNLASMPEEKFEQVLSGLKSGYLVEIRDNMKTPTETTRHEIPKAIDIIRTYTGDMIPPELHSQKHLLARVVACPHPMCVEVYMRNGSEPELSWVYTYGIGWSQPKRNQIETKEHQPTRKQTIW